MITKREFQQRVHQATLDVVDRRKDDQLETRRRFADDELRLFHEQICAVANRLEAVERVVGEVLAE
jgi:hypothetical protein